MHAYYTIDHSPFYAKVTLQLENLLESFHCSIMLNQTGSIFHNLKSGDDGIRMVFSKMKNLKQKPTTTTNNKLILDYLFLCNNQIVHHLFTYWIVIFVFVKFYFYFDGISNGVRIQNGR